MKGGSTPCDRRDRKIRCKFVKLFLPVINKRSRADNEGRRKKEIGTLPLLRILKGGSTSRDRRSRRCKRSRIRKRGSHRRRSCGGCDIQVGGGQDADHLQGLAQPHLIGQDAAKTGAFQCFDPFEAVRLVGAKRIFQRLRRFCLRFADRVKIADERAVDPVSGGSKCFVLFEQLIQIQRPVERHFCTMCNHGFRGEIQCVHEKVCLREAVRIGEIQIISTGEPVEALLFLIAFHHFQQLVRREFSGSELQIYDIAVYRNSDLYRRYLTDVMSAKRIRAVDSSVVFQQRKPTLQKGKHLFVCEKSGKRLLLRQPGRKITLNRRLDTILLCGIAVNICCLPCV